VRARRKSLQKDIHFLGKALKVLHELHESGLIRAHALGGGTAATDYVEPTLTCDLDIFFIPTK
jgi:hypothetical protein